MIYGLMKQGFKMIRNYIKIAFRNLAKYKIHSIVNILGLSIGIAISILIMILVQNEQSYDKHNVNWERIYRVNKKAKVNESEIHGVNTQYPLGETMLNEIDEVENVVRLLRGSHKLVSYKDKHFSAENFFYADSSFFSFFTIPMIKGNKETALKKEYSIVLPQKTAEKYFGSEDPIGKILEADNLGKFKVTGICEDVPENSHFHFDYLATTKGVITGKEVNNWTIEFVSTYVLLREGSDPKKVNKGLQSIVRRNIYPGLQEMDGTTFEDNSGNAYYELYLQPLKDIHFTTDLNGQFEAGMHKGYIYVFTFIALLILVIACVNYMNLSTAKSATRAREVALRKVVGATRKQMILQFLSESVLFGFIALFISLVVLEFLMRPFNKFSGMNLDIPYLDSWFLLPVFIFGTLLIGVFSGSYPAFYLSGFKIINTIKGRNFEGMKSTRLRGMLVLFQFTTSIILAICSMIIFQQVKFFQKTNLGFNEDNILVIQRAYALEDNKTKFKEVLKKHPEIESASVTYSMPGRAVDKYSFYLTDRKKNEMHFLSHWMTDYDYLETMNMHLLEGDYFNPESKNKYRQALVNETTVKQLGLSDPVGMTLREGMMYEKGYDLTIRGVIKDFHYESLHKEIEPIVITLLPETFHIQYMAVRLTGNDIPGTMKYIEKSWSKFVKNQPFNFYFLDKDLDQLYAEEKNTARIFTIFTFLSILIACLGLLGLASHSAEQRTKEIGIRKAMGASIKKIIFMLSTHFTRWVVWANIIAFPVAYIGMKIWLSKFAYHINIEAYLFFVAAVIALIIALVTVSFQAVRSARANPVEALQYE